MTNLKIRKQVQEDAAIMEEYIYKDGEIPPVFFVHFPKLSRKISNLMNTLPVGTLPVKKGFFVSLNDPFLMEKRHEFFQHLGTVIAVLELLKVVEAPESIVFCTEAWASLNDPEITKIRPSKDPKAKDIFLANGLTRTGESFVTVKEKHIEIVKKGKKQAVKYLLVPINDQSKKLPPVPLLNVFFESYTASLQKMATDKGYRQFEAQAKENPTEAFRQAIEAAMTMAKMAALKDITN